jgi:hypothetical protein
MPHGHILLNLESILNYSTSFSPSVISFYSYIHPFFSECWFFFLCYFPLFSFFVSSSTSVRIVLPVCIISFILFLHYFILCPVFIRTVLLIFPSHLLRLLPLFFHLFFNAILCTVRDVQNLIPRVFADLNVTQLLISCFLTKWRLSSTFIFLTVLFFNTTQLLTFVWIVYTFHALFNYKFWIIINLFEYCLDCGISQLQMSSRNESIKRPLKYSASC